MNYLIPIWAILFGVIFFQEEIFMNYIVGLILVILGINISQKETVV
jgi:drug/metabolite transporter (DMT)-like permease